MSRSSIRYSRTLVIAATTALLTSGALAQTALQGPVRFVDLVEVTDHDDQADIAVQFNCSMRFVSNVPATEGPEVRIQLQPLPDCRLNPLAPVADDTPPISGGTSIVASARVESIAPGQLTLTLQFRKPERFVIAQGIDTHGLRIRLVDRLRGRGKILITQQTDTINNYAINLESQTSAFDPAVIAVAHERLKAPVFVSETTVDGVKWYRLRVGPIDRRVEADRILERALEDYPRAWLAIGDDAVTSDPNAPATGGPLPGVEPIGSDPPLDPATLKDLLAQARAAMAAADYPKAIKLLTKLQRQPEFPQRARAQELIGLARERSGQLAHAKAEYEEYLRRYPNGEAAERVKSRLRTLRLASAESREGSGGGTSEAKKWRVDGGVSQLFRYDGTRIDSTSTAGGTTPPPPGSTTTTGQTASYDALYTDVDLLARRHGEDIDFLTRLSAGYAKDFANTGIGDTKRVSIASVELVDQPVGLLARLGRQISAQDGIIGTFDGLFLSYRFRHAWAVDAVAGYPVEETSLAPETQRRFETLALEYSPIGSHWGGDIFATTQQFDGVRDRQAVGIDARFLASNASVMSLIDYDMSFKSLNAAVLMGVVQLPARWTLSFDAEHRNSPILTTFNALIGQQAITLAQLEQTYTLQQIYQLALDRTPITNNYSLTATHPLGERLQFAVTAAATEIGGTPASGGVPAQPGLGMQLSYQAQLYATSLWRPGDFNAVTVSYGSTQIGKLESVSATSRFPLGNAWRIGPRLTFDRDTISADDSTELTFFPSMLVEYLRERSLVQMEVGGQIGKRDALLQSQSTKRYYLSIAYRINF